MWKHLCLLVLGKEKLPYEHAAVRLIADLLHARRVGDFVREGE